MSKGKGITDERGGPGRKVSTPPPEPARRPPALAEKFEGAKISVVIPSTGAPELLGPCIASLPSGIEIVVVLSANLDKGQVPDFLATNPNVVVVDYTYEPFCFAKAINLGVQHSHGEYLVLLNDDTRFSSPTDLHRLLVHLRNPAAGLVAPLVTYSGVKAQQSARPLNEGLRAMPMLPAIVWALRRSVFAEVGGLDERYRGYGLDDDDFCWALRQKGYRVFLDTTLCVSHRGHASFSKERDWTYIHSEINKWAVVFQDKWGLSHQDARRKSMTLPLSVVIPCFNCRDWIETAIDSVLSQAGLLLPPQIVCVDDSSTDETWPFLQSLAKVDGFPMVVLQQPHSGPSRARNVGIRRASGTHLVFLDADDVMPKDRCAQTLELLASHHMAYGQMEAFREMTGPPKLRRERVANIVGPTPKRLRDGNGFRIGTAAARREVFEVHDCWLDEELLGGEDWDWLLTCVEAGLKVTCSNDVWLYRRVVPNSHHLRVNYANLRPRILSKHSELLTFAETNLALPPRPLEHRWHPKTPAGYL